MSALNSGPLQPSGGEERCSPPLNAPMLLYRFFWHDSTISLPHTCTQTSPPTNFASLLCGFRQQEVERQKKEKQSGWGCCRGGGDLTTSWGGFMSEFGSFTRENTFITLVQPRGVKTYKWFMAAEWAECAWTSFVLFHFSFFCFFLNKCCL